MHAYVLTSLYTYVYICIYIYMFRYVKLTCRGMLGSSLFFYITNIFKMRPFFHLQCSLIQTGEKKHQLPQDGATC